MIGKKIKSNMMQALKASLDGDPIINNLGLFYGPFQQLKSKETLYRARVKRLEANVTSEQVLSRLNFGKNVTKKFGPWKLTKNGLTANGEAAGKAYVVELGANYVKVYISRLP